MDAAEDKDIKLQRASEDLLSEFQDRLPKFLWRSPSATQIQAASNLHRPRRTVRQSDTDRLIQLLEPFQEWPQLLDPHLANLVPPLIAAYLDYLGTHGHRYRSTAGVLLIDSIPLPRAICRLLYTLCKVRGEKVVSRFFNNEPRYLEPMLDAFQKWNMTETSTEGNIPVKHGPLIWEERYIMLLWLSHLLLAPFDLASISTVCDVEQADITSSGLSLPSALPGIARRIVPICFKYVVAASKEREAATKLLVRLALRPDMRRAGLLDSLVLWALSSLESRSNDDSFISIYGHAGVLSFLAGTLVSAEKEAIAPFIPKIFQTLQRINSEQSALSQDIRSSALARKIVIKILRATAILVLQRSPSLADAQQLESTSMLLEEVIEHLLSALADKDTPVRYAASKALSVVALSLDLSMASEVVEAVLGSLEEDVLWEDPMSGLAIPNNEVGTIQTATLKRNLTAVNPLRWQGLVLTLAHLLFRRSPPPEMLPSILNALLLGLAFEQRASTGSSFGTNVRDAACFGIWALSRRYTTKELLAVDTAQIRAANVRTQAMNIPQILAIELVVAASIDPSGNIRRGSSAALQELIGRHPDTVLEGIPLVQVVDYHAVARRSRAVIAVAVGSAKLHDVYGTALFIGLLGWRGIGAPDAESRRLAATAIGVLGVFRGHDGIASSTKSITNELHSLQLGEVEQRHGLLLALAAIVVNVTELSAQQSAEASSVRSLAVLANLWNVFDTVPSLSEKALTSSVLRPELTAEASCCLVSSLARASTVLYRERTMLPRPSERSISKCIETLSLSLLRTEDNVVTCASTAAQDLFAVMNLSKRIELVRAWISILTVDQASPMGGAGKGFGYLAALGSVFKCFPADPSGNVTPEQEAIIHTLVTRAGLQVEVESRVAAIRSLGSGVLESGVLNAKIMNALSAALDDYTTDQRGDVGSLVRIQGIDAVRIAWRNGVLVQDEDKRGLLASVCRLAAEKLDKVRFRAWSCIEEILGQECFAVVLTDISQISLHEYFLQLLSLMSENWLRLPVLEGYVTSAGVGSESLLRASRLALVDYLGVVSDDHRILNICNDLTELLRRNLASDRLAIPLLEVLGFLFDAGILQQLDDGSFNFYALIQKAHFKSGSVHKLEAAVKLYAGLAEVASTSQEAVMKLAGMLLHPFPKIRNAAADALYVLHKNDTLKMEDWSRPAKELRDCVEALKGEIAVAARETQKNFNAILRLN
ncbi:MAG: hypothetical protein M1830_010607 [Pleopsidium flavum]|nr:MAG: hypothetical protein M1830_010607 [Pleopsidium flavum]